MSTVPCGPSLVCDGTIDLECMHALFTLVQVHSKSWAYLERTVLHDLGLMHELV